MCCLKVKRPEWVYTAFKRGTTLPMWLSFLHVPVALTALQQWRMKTFCFLLKEIKPKLLQQSKYSVFAAGSLYNSLQTHQGKYKRTQWWFLNEMYQNTVFRYTFPNALTFLLNSRSTYSYFLEKIIFKYCFRRYLALMRWYNVFSFLSNWLYTNRRVSVVGSAF